MIDKKKGILNVTVSIFFKIAILIFSILVRRYLIRYLGNEINGLNSLYLSIIGMLSVAELGVGSAITFCMYKPIVENDLEKVSALYRLFTKLYIIIGTIIAVCGFVLMPALPYLAKGYDNVDVNLYLTFAIMLISVVLSYVFSAKTSLLNAHKNDYITTTITSIGMLLQYCLQIGALIIFKTFTAYLLCRVIAILLQWVMTECITRRRYHKIIHQKVALDSETKATVTKSIKAMFMHKIGGILVNTADSIIISAFISVAILGKYTNYTTIVTSMVSVISLCFIPLTSIIGHMLVESDKENVNKYFNFFYMLNFIIGLIFFLGYYAVIDNLITILFGNDLEMAKSISFVITLNYFIRFMRQTVELFKDASGTFYYDRWKPLVEGILNVVLSIAFVFLFGVVGVIVATVITTLLICHVVEPYVLFKHEMKAPVKKYYVKNYGCMLLFTLLLGALHYSMILSDNQWIELFANGGISLAYSLAVSAVVVLINKDFRHYAKNFLLRLKRHKNNQPPIIDAKQNVKSDVVVEADDNVVKDTDNAIDI